MGLPNWLIHRDEALLTTLMDVSTFAGFAQ